MGMFFLAMTVGLHAYWSEKVELFEAAREKYEQRKHEILEGD